MITLFCPNLRGEQNEFLCVGKRTHFSHNWYQQFREQRDKKRDVVTTFAHNCNMCNDNAFILFRAMPSLDPYLMHVSEAKGPKMNVVQIRLDG